MRRWLAGAYESGPNTGAVLDGSSVDIVLDEMRRTLAAQQAQIAIVDAKASFFLTAGSLVIGFSGLPGAAASTVASNRAWAVPALVLYLALLIAVVQAYRPHGLTSSALDPRELPSYLFEKPEFTKRQLIATLAVAHEQNVQPLELKGLWLQRAQAFLGMEAAYLVVVTIGRSEWGIINAAAHRLL